MSALLEECGYAEADSNQLLIEDEVGRLVLNLNNISPPLFLVPQPTVETEIKTDYKTGVLFGYPDMQFKFNDARMRGSGVIAANASTRYRGVLHAIADSAEEYRDVTVEEAEKRVKDLKKFLGSAVTVSKLKARKDRHVPFEAVYDELQIKLSTDNEPSWQAFRQLELDYPDLGPGIIKSLKRPVTEAIHAEKIKRLYDERIAKLKITTKDKPD